MTDMTNTLPEGVPTERRKTATPIDGCLDQRCPKADAADVQKVAQSITELEGKVAEVSATLAATVGDVQDIKTGLDGNSADTRQVLDILRAGKGFFAVVGWVGNVVKWCALVGAPVVAFWYALKTGGKP